MGKLTDDWVNVSISHGTLRDVDLIPVFEEILESAGAGFDRPASVDRLLAGEELTESDWDEVSWYLNEDLFDLLNEIAPDGTYFGAHPGDGADFGFWQFEEE